ncbi:dTMP kinase [Terriglobus saanensis]|uniref:Thymidylate kinase n=1 Tax=Terriglobus saanensis (strain ATCC BAA-1853 / DSM 23119 / SP1PR4) TaxID=401053 RepID=E8V6I4_TERSS|nr:dTMP kinase [Terriglobus saanensis]ADV82723.1 thymidylate kinase [Terriglobus saanensis SP1PR4]
MAGFFISFEGLDGSGKTTQLRRLETFLIGRGREVVSLRQPGGTALGDRIRAVVLDSKTEAAVGKIAPMTEMALMFADRAQAIAEVILPALEAGKIVLCDRWTDSTEAYQGGGRGLGAEKVLEMHHAVCGDLWPALTILLLPDLQASLKRARRRNDRHIAAVGTDENRFETEGDGFYGRIHAVYTAIGYREKARVVTIGDGNLDEVEAAVRSAVLQRI